jgi:hypothetical protein
MVFALGVFPGVSVSPFCDRVTKGNAAVKPVIASEAKQSSLEKSRADCFVASLLAMTINQIVL